MSNKEDRKRLLLLSFQENKELSTKQIMDILHTDSKGTVNTYINYLRSDGFIIEEKILTQGRKVYSVHIDKEIDYPEITKKIWQNFIILTSLDDDLSDEPHVIRNQLIDYILSEKELSIDLKQSALYMRIDDLCKEGLIIQKRETISECIYPSSSTPIVKAFKIEEADKLVKDLSMVPSSAPLHKSISDFRQTLEELSETIATIEAPPSFLSLGKKYEKGNIEQVLTNVFGSCTFKENVCDIVYETKKGRKDIRIAIGKIVYVIEKDSLYIIGKEYIDDSPSSNSIINFDRILKVSTSTFRGQPIKNEFWNSNEYNSIFEEMLSISVEPCERVVLRFDDVHFVEEKIKTLVKQRKNAKVEKKDGYIFYYDEIRGMADLRNYLRSFTERCVVISPDTLVNETRDSIMSSLMLYEEPEK